MKVNIEFDCTPDEASQFIELPDVSSPPAEMIDGLWEKLWSLRRVWTLNLL